MDAPAHTLAEPVTALARKLDLKANSLIITIFGDAVLPRGGSIWLGSLITLAGYFGIGERLVRTGVYRLSQEGWLESTAKGRKSYYTITDTGRDKFEAAQQRIYASAPHAWDNNWSLVQILPSMSQADRQALRRELGWLGLGQISPTLLAHPAADNSMIRRIVEALELTEHVFVFRAAMEDYIDTDRVRDVATQVWSLDALNEDYARFVRNFSEMPQRIESNPDFSALTSLILRILLIHDYRRILLKDPQLPDELLDGGWNGREARALSARIYRAVAGPAEQALDEAMETMGGPPPAPSSAFWQRFGGLR